MVVPHSIIFSGVFLGIWCSLSLIPLHLDLRTPALPGLALPRVWLLPGQVCHSSALTSREELLLFGTCSATLPGLCVSVFILKTEQMGSWGSCILAGHHKNTLPELAYLKLVAIKTEPLTFLQRHVNILQFSWEMSKEKSDIQLEALV